MKTNKITEKTAISILNSARPRKGSYGRLQIAFDMAIKALEKQIPKKTTFVDTRFRHHGRSVSDGVSIAKCYKCPGCNTHIFHVWDDENYCKSCGQALDWSEQNE